MRFLLLLLLSTPALVYAHGGGLSEIGCHMYRQTGLPHCHRGPFRDYAFDDPITALDLINSITDFTTQLRLDEHTVRVSRGKYRCIAIYENDLLNRYHRCWEKTPRDLFEEVYVRSRPVQAKAIDSTKFDEALESRGLSNESGN